MEHKEYCSLRRPEYTGECDCTTDEELRREYNENQEDDTQPEMTFEQWKAGK